MNRKPQDVSASYPREHQCQRCGYVGLRDVKADVSLESEYGAQAGKVASLPRSVAYRRFVTVNVQLG